MRILLDSHALVWFILGNERMPVRIRSLIEDDGNETSVSAVSIWEIANKVRLGKWPEATDVVAMVNRLVIERSFQPLPVSLQHAEIAGRLIGPHRDPFDRLLAAQSQVEAIPLITADPAFAGFGTRTMW